MYKLLGFVLMIVMITSPAWAAKKDKHEMSPEMQKKMAEMEKMTSPGSEHQVLDQFVGNWKVSSKSWMAPGSEPMTSEGKSKMKWVLDGRFLEQEFKGKWGDKDFRGMGFIGYDKMTNQYVSTWMDSMSTGQVQSTGTYDAKTKTITDTGEYACPMTGDKNRWFRSEWKVISDNKNVYTMFSKDSDGKEYKSLEIEYSR